MSRKEKIVVEVNDQESRRGALRLAWGIIGIASLVVGVILLIDPNVFGDLVAIALSIYALVAGVVCLALAFIGKEVSSWGRIGYGAIGIACIAAGIIALVNLTGFRDIVLTVLAIALGVVWIFDGGMTLYAYFRSSLPVWNLIFGIISILAGVILVIRPLWSYSFVIVTLGVALILIGLMRAYGAFAGNRS